MHSPSHAYPLINSLPLMTLPSPPLPPLFDLLPHPHLTSLFHLSSPLPLTSPHPTPHIHSPLPTPTLPCPSHPLPLHGPPLHCPFPPSPPSPHPLQFLKTALHHAAEHGHVDVIRVLVKDYHASVEAWEIVSFLWSCGSN